MTKTFLDRYKDAPHIIRIPAPPLPRIKPQAPPLKPLMRGGKIKKGGIAQGKMWRP